MSYIFSLISACFIPVMSAVIISYGTFKKAPVYDYFIEGAKSGLKTALEILPFLIGIFLVVNCLTASQVLTLINSLLSPLLELLQIPSDLLPLMVLRAVSGSGSIETMSLSRRAVKEGQRALIVDDFLKAGGTAKGMIDLMGEFNVEVVGTAFVMAREQKTAKLIRGEKALMVMELNGSDADTLDIHPAEWLND